MLERLQKILSRAGVASRRASEQLMLEGRVTVNGAPIRELGTKADPDCDDIRVDGRAVARGVRQRYILLNKPRGYVTSRSDPGQRPTVLDLLGQVRDYVYPVGRLDYDSEGLLLLTNDGDLAAKLTHPRHAVPRVYEARVGGVPDAHDLDRLARGVVVDGKLTGPAEVVLLSHRPARRDEYPRLVASSRTGRGGDRDRRAEDRQRRGAEAALRITIREGRNRQVRKMCEAIGHPVSRFRRVAFGPITDRRLKPGQWRDLTADEVQRLKTAVGRASDRSSVHRP